MLILFSASTTACTSLVEVDRNVSTSCDPVKETCWPTLVTQGFVLREAQLFEDNTKLMAENQACRDSQNRR